MKKTLLSIFVLASTFISTAQGYAFSVENQPYVNLSNSTSLNNGTTWDDPSFTIPVGFNFSLYNALLSNIYISDIGYGSLLTATSGSTGVTPLLFAFGADIIDRGYDFNGGSTGSLSNISYLETGFSGSRILKIEWNNVGFYSDLDDNNISTDYAHFQVWLHEASGNIEIHFGPSSITQPNLCYDGETGTFIGVYSGFDLDNFTSVGSGLELTGSASTPTAQSSLDPYMTFLNGTIPNGKVFKFSRTLANLDELSGALELSIIPNPSTGIYQVTTLNKSSIDGPILITNQLGQAVEEVISSSFQNNKATIDLTNCKNGVYFVTVHANGYPTTKRIIKK